MTQPAKRGNGDSVTILMGVCNGAAHLPDQLHSIAAQTHTNWTLKASDDGSTDATDEILGEFASEHPTRVSTVAGPQAGFSANFMSLIRSLSDNAGYVCFADQDDIWQPDKVARGIEALANTRERPTLYCGRCWYWYPETGRKTPSPQIKKPAAFRNALIENVASGNTIMMNPAATLLARTAAGKTDSVFAHDWWLYLLITGAGGDVIFDNGAPSLLYRQHDGNVIGAGKGFAQQVYRKTMVLKGAFAQRLSSNFVALDQARDVLTLENRGLVDDFVSARHDNLYGRVNTLRRIKPYRQTIAGNVGFWGAATLGYI